MHFADRLTMAIRARGTPGVVGIDPVLERLPPALRPRARTVVAAAGAVEVFGRGVIDAVGGHVAIVKINSGFFEAFQAAGVRVYFELVAYAHQRGLLVIGDIKRGDIGSTAALYARGHLSDPGWDDVDPACVPDAVTLAGYLGEGAVRPFVDAARAHGRGVFVLVRPSDPGADEVHEFGQRERFYEHVSRLVGRWGVGPGLIGQCGLSCVGAVVAPKDPESTAALRAALPHTPFLVPGYGAQGADAAACRPCFRADGSGAIVNASRSVIYAFENPKCVRQYGDDWTASVAAAARDFATDVGRLM